MDVARAESAGTPRIVRLPAQVDMRNSVEVSAAIGKAIEEASVVDVDCSGLTFIDSSGAQALLEGYRAAADAGTALRLAGLCHGPLRETRTLPSGKRPHQVREPIEVRAGV